MESLINMDLMKLMKECDTQDECRLILEELRWPDGVRAAHHASLTRFRAS